MPELPPEKRAAPVAYEGTRLESVEEIRQAVKARRAGTVKEESAPPEVQMYRPLRRPPMALLCILDDGKEDGEWVRLRGDRLVVGRSEGDVVIPHDSMMSSRHAELSRQLEQGTHRWYLTDLQSTNGTYVRVGHALLKHHQEMLIGSRRFRFDAGLMAGAATDSAVKEEEPAGTRGWRQLSPSDLNAALVELTPQGDGQRYPLAKPDNWVGSDPRVCAVCLANDPLANPHHARLYRDKKGRWLMENTKSVNGVWLRIDHIALEAACQFQLGEQRFLVKIL